MRPLVKDVLWNKLDHCFCPSGRAPTFRERKEMWAPRLHCLLNEICHLFRQHPDGPLKRSVLSLNGPFPPPAANFYSPYIWNFSSMVTLLHALTSPRQVAVNRTGGFSLLEAQGMFHLILHLPCTPATVCGGGGCLWHRHWGRPVSTLSGWQEVSALWDFVLEA